MTFWKTCSLNPVSLQSLNHSHETLRKELKTNNKNKNKQVLLLHSQHAKQLLTAFKQLSTFWSFGFLFYEIRDGAEGLF